MVSGGGGRHEGVDPKVVDAATVFVDQLLEQARQEVLNKRAAAGESCPASARPDYDADDEDYLTVNGLLRRGTRWQSRARDAGRGIVTRLLTTLRLCK